MMRTLHTKVDLTGRVAHAEFQILGGVVWAVDFAASPLITVSTSTPAATLRSIYYVRAKAAILIKFQY